MSVISENEIVYYGSRLYVANAECTMLCLNCEYTCMMYIFVSRQVVRVTMLEMRLYKLIVNV